MYYRKVLVAEDLDTAGYGITMMLKQELHIEEVVLTQYCDDAYLKFQNAILNNAPFDLLITDLSFKQDHRTIHLNSGKALIERIREKGHKIPIIICSVEEKAAMIKRFTKANNVTAYVLKGRDGLKELKKAVRASYNGDKFFSEKIMDISKRNPSVNIEEYDISILTYLSNGLSQNEIASLLKSNGVSPSSLSSIEKRLNRLKDVLKANNNVQLVANAKDIGLI